MTDPRNSNGAAMRKLRASLKSQRMPCALCGRPIDYSLATYRDPKDGKVKPHPQRFELDHVRPVSRWREYGYASAQECALDPSNAQAAHRICNQRKGNGRSARESAPKGAVRPSRRDW